VVCEIAALAILPLLGTARKPAFKCKAAESRDMIGFTAAALHKACENPDASRTLKHLRDSADYLVGVYKILTLKEVTLSTETCDLFEVCTLSFIASWKQNQVRHDNETPLCDAFGDAGAAVWEC
jgi:hypothetical protein